MPGIIDAHVHFDRAGALINDANLMTVSDEAGLRREIGRVAGLLADGEWITEGLWGAYEQWDSGRCGEGDAGQKDGLAADEGHDRRPDSGQSLFSLPLRSQGMAGQLGRPEGRRLTEGDGRAGDRQGREADRHRLPAFPGL